MSGKPAARQGDPTECPKKGHKATTITSGSPDVLFNGVPAARMGDTTSCGSAIVGQVIPNVLINGKPAVVVGSTGAHGDTVTAGSGDIFIGGGVIIGGGITFGDGAAMAGAGLAAGAASALSGTSSSLRAKGLEEFPDDIISQLDDRHDYEEEDEDEEEETELEVEQHITLRIGVFFDGTGNNQTNSALTAECRRQDLNDFEPEVLADITASCIKYGYKDTNRDGLFDQAPDNSYGNEVSNVARLYRTYQSQATSVLPEDADVANISVYVDGIGTTSEQADSKWGLAFGKYKTGVVKRVDQSIPLIIQSVSTMIDMNPQIIIDEVQFDVFGFSRGAAAARHFINEVLKPGAGCVADALTSWKSFLSPSFIPKSNVKVEFVGLFDTVAGIADPLAADLDPGNDRNPGINLYLPPGCAKRVVHLTSQHENRHNFSLNRVHESHVEIALPGVHSDIGGGYHQIGREDVLLDKPRVIYQTRITESFKIMNSRQWRDRSEAIRRLEAAGLPGEGRFEPFETQVLAEQRKSGRVYNTVLYLGMKRTVRGELSRVPLRIMHQLAIADGVPFEDLDEKAISLPADLQPIGDKIIAFAMSGLTAPLSAAESQHLISRYIHASASWTPVSRLLVNRPRKNGRAVYQDLPQKGYPA